MATRTRKRVQNEKTSATSVKRVISKLKSVDGEDLVEEFDTEVFETEPAYVRAAAGMTRNLGDYESLRVDVAITLPCYKEDVERTYGVAADTVAVLLEEEIEKYLKSGK